MKEFAIHFSLFILFMMISCSTDKSTPLSTSSEPIASVTITPEKMNRIGTSDNFEEDMIYIPEGEFTMGDNNYFSDRPEHAVYLDAFYIDRHEVTNAQYAAYLNATLTAGSIQVEGTSVKKDGNELFDFYYDYREISYDNGAFKVVSGKENYPVFEVSWYGADAYAKYYGKRLPTEAEWEKAARGNDMRQYPWGADEPTTSHCNFNHDVGHTTPVGQYTPTGDSPYGCADMAGNVDEWCNDWYDLNYYENSPSHNPQGASSGEWRCLRGGNYDSSIIRITGRGATYPDVTNADMGFRCVRDVDSSSGIR